MRYFFCISLLLLSLATAEAGEKKIRALLIDGQNNHAWTATTPVLKKTLEESGRFTVDVATSPPKLKEPTPPRKPKEATPENEAKYKNAQEKYQQDVQNFKPMKEAYQKAMAQFHPDLSRYDVVVSNYNGDKWSDQLSNDLDERLKAGQIGLVIVHAANNSFGNWKDYNLMIGMGWRGNKGGERLFLDDNGKEVRVPSGQGDGSGHRYSGKFSVVVRDPNHPITKGMPLEWLHNNDELYDNMRGPIENVHLLATAYSKGTKQNEPMIWTVRYGKGRVFHTPMGHDVNAMSCVGFQTTLLRGAEWAATGQVSIPIPPNFPTASKLSIVKAK